GISLNIETPEGQDVFKRLVATSDVVIESFPTGYLDQLSLGYNNLKQVNPKIILTSITPFGQNEPYKYYKASDLVLMSMGGITWLTGNSDRPPVNIGGPSQAFLFAGTYAVIATLIALYYRETGGEGQHVDVSTQQCLVPVTLNTIPHWTINANLIKRAGNRRSGLTSGATQRQTWQCKDGYVTLTMYGGTRGMKTNRPLIQWMEEEKMAPDCLVEKDWASFDLATTTAEDWEVIEKPVAEFFSKHTRAELFKGALQRGIMLFPVYELKDLLSDIQLKMRKFWRDVKSPEIGSITHPGAFAQFSKTPIKTRRVAPAIGEHNLEIYQGEMGISKEQLLDLRQRDVRRFLQMIIVLLVVSFGIFMGARVSGNPLDLMLPVTASQEDYDRAAKNLGLDKPIPEQYIIFLGNAIQGDFGRSIKTNQPVMELISEKVPNSLKLAGFAFILSLIMGVPLGVLAAARRGKAEDGIARLFAGIGQSIPGFWLGLMLILVFAVNLGWLPASGMGSWKHYLMPGFVEAWCLSAGFIRLLRSSMLEILDSEFIKMARMKGLSETIVIWKHALRNSLLPLVSFAGVYVAILVTSSIVTEVVFAWPGFGRLVYSAIINRDYPIMQGVVLTGASIVMIANFTADIIYAYLDPRIRY
ncbi:CoA transferase, partial [Chloroflexota bacterium]